MFGDDVLRRAGDEVVVAELRLDLGDFELLLRDLPVETRLLRLEIDDSSERQRNRFAADDEEQRAGRRRLGGIDRANAGETPDALAPGARAIWPPARLER